MHESFMDLNVPCDYFVPLPNSCRYAGCRLGRPWRNELMPLILRTMKKHIGWEDAKDDYAVMDGETSVGRVYKEHGKAGWFWSVNTPGPGESRPFRSAIKRSSQQRGHGLFTHASAAAGCEISVFGNFSEAERLIMNMRTEFDWNGAKSEVVACPCCGSLHSISYRSKHDIVTCADCETIYLRTRYTAETLDEFYQWYGGDWNYVALPKNQEDIDNAPIRRTWFLREITTHGLPGNKILDVGCSWGAFLLSARENGFDPRGIEITRNAAEYATNELGIPVTTTPLADLGIEDESISLVTMIHTLEHLPDTQRALNKAFRVLQRGGLFCGMVPNIDSLCSRTMGDDWQWLEPSCHYVYFSPKSIRKNLQRAGFVIENLYTIKGDFDRAEIETAVRLRHGAELNSTEMDEIIARVEAEGRGEELRFFARKPH
jgi:ubiquinone/menaquinone biosynthesis C-methylase UbiE